MPLRRYVAKRLQFLSIGPVTFIPSQDPLSGEYLVSFETSNPELQALIERSVTGPTLAVTEIPESDQGPTTMSRTALNKMGKGELQELLKAHDAAFPEEATKAELIDLIDELQESWTDREG